MALAQQPMKKTCERCGGSFITPLKKRKTCAKCRSTQRSADRGYSQQGVEANRPMSAPRYKVVVTEVGTGSRVCEVPTESYGKAEQVERGLRINMNRKKYTTQIDTIGEVPKPKIVAYSDNMFMHNYGGHRIFEVTATLSDGTRRNVELDVDTLKEMGTGINSLNHTKKLREWLASDAGTAYVEGLVSK